MASDYLHIEYAVADGIAQLTMARGKVNALNLEMVAEMLSALEQARTDVAVRSLILASNRPGFFSAGFDVKEVFLYDRQRMAEHLRNYGSLIHHLHQFPKPVIAAITGHNFAGGAILALACDYRVMAEGEFSFAVNEIKIGVVIPPAIFQLCSDVVGARHARQMILSGEPVPSAKALEIGLVDELAPAAEVLGKSQAIAHRLCTSPAPTLAAVKEVIRKSAGELAFAPDVEPWFTEEAEAMKTAMLRRLT